MIAINIVTGDPNKSVRELVAQTQTSALGEAKLMFRQIVVPFAMPLLVGPGVIANLILYATETDAANNDTLFLGLIGVTVAMALLTFVILLSGQVLQRVLGEVGMSLITRVLGLLLAAIGAQFILTGLSNVIVHSIAPQILKLFLGACLTSSRPEQRGFSRNFGKPDALFWRSIRHQFLALRFLTREPPRNPLRVIMWCSNWTMTTMPCRWRR